MSVSSLETTLPCELSIYDFLNEKGYHWSEKSDKSKYWTMYTMWDPDVSCKLDILRQLDDDGSARVTWHTIWTLLVQKFASFEIFEFDELARFTDTKVVIRIDDENSYRASGSNLIETVDVSQYVFLAVDKKVELRRTPLTLVAGGGLADVLKGVVRYNDIIIAIGTMKSGLSSPDPSRLCLLNFDDADGDVIIIRVPQLEPEEGDVQMVEFITPAQTPNTYNFNYRLRRGREFMKMIRPGGYFYWDPKKINEAWTMETCLVDELTAPLLWHWDIRSVFHRILGTPLSLPPSLPEAYEKDSPVFSARLLDSEKEVSYRQYPAIGMFVPSATDLLAFIFFLLSVFLLCISAFWIIHTFYSEDGRGDVLGHGPGRILQETSSLVYVNREVMCPSQKTVVTFVIDFVQYVVQWAYENSGLSFIVQQIRSMLGNSTCVPSHPRRIII